eukprot:SAG22_NODE_4090_length_1390_cov_1.408211_1_plen_327_part_01
MAMMSGPTDEHRFVALLVLPKILAQLPGGPTTGGGGGGTSEGDGGGWAAASSQVQAELLNRLDWPFFRRLLLAPAPAPPPPGAQAAAPAAAEMQAVAVAVLASLVEAQAALAEHRQLPTIVGLVPAMLSAFGPRAAAAAARPTGQLEPAGDWPALRDLAVVLCAAVDAAAQLSQQSREAEEARLLEVPGFFDVLLDLLEGATLAAAAGTEQQQGAVAEVCTAAAIGLEVALRPTTPAHRDDPGEAAPLEVAADSVPPAALLGLATRFSSWLSGPGGSAKTAAPEVAAGGAAPEPAEEGAGGSSGVGSGKGRLELQLVGLGLLCPVVG